ncbi:universal stress protein [bacterium]|nr:MAG: universal stress protein [bacterium]
MQNVKKILVVNRSTRQCNMVTGFGVSLAKKFNADLCIVSVVHDPFSVTGWNLPFTSFENEFKSLMSKAREELDDCISSAKTMGLNIKSLVRGENPVEAVLKVIEEEKIDLLLLPAHEEGRLEHFLFGRTNEELVRRMPCSIFLLKSKPAPDAQ